MLHALRPRYSSITIQNKDDLVYHMTAHLRMNAVYWGLTALCVMKNKDALNREEMIDFVMSCWDDQAGAHTSRSVTYSPTIGGRRIWCKPGSRCSYPRNIECHTNTGNLRCT